MLIEKSKPGRKKVQDKKIGITIYIKPSDIVRMGGKDNVRESLLNHFEKIAKK